MTEWLNRQYDAAADWLTAFAGDPLLLWATALVVGFPLLTILLQEVGDRLAEKQVAARSVVGSLRTVVLPLVAAYLFLTQVVGMGGVLTLPRVVLTALLIAAIHVVLVTLNALVFESAERASWRAKVPQLFLDLSRFFLILVGTAVVLSRVWQFDLGNLLAALGVGSIVIGLALQDTLGNLMSGVAILFERPFSVGHWLRVGDVEGRVVELNWRSVRLVTRDNDSHVVPNSVIADNAIRNFSKPAALHMERIGVGFSYDDPPGKVKRVMLQIARQTAGVRTDPPPQVFTLSYDDFAISYEVRLWLSGYEEVPRIRDAFNTRVWYAAQRHGLNIPFPIRTVHHYDGPARGLRLEPPITVAEVRGDALFHEADDDQLQRLVPEMSRQSFAAGEELVAVGEQCDTLFILRSGTASLWTRDQGGGRQTVLELSAGDVFGAMSVLTEGPSQVAVTATTDVAALALPSAALRVLLAENRPLARDLTQMVEARRDAVRRIRRAAHAANGRVSSRP